jgi:hypothetical protein
LNFPRYAFVLAMAAALAGCNSTDSTLGVEGASGPKNAPDPATALPPPSISGSTDPAASVAGSLSTTAPQVAAISAGDVRMRFAPIIGAPVEKVTSLSRRFSMRAKEQKVTIVGSTDQTATHVFKGYFSVLSEGENSTVVYVFDILDPGGSRLHRIQGQEVVTGSNTADPWAAIPATTLEKIADKAMAEFSTWRSTQA